MDSALPDWIADNLQWWVAGLIIFAGLLVYGLSDLLRFSLRRVWAISGVCFDESVRRKVLWITPLAMLGVVVVAQLQKPLDEQDAIRQTIKFSLFAAGLVVTLATVILACTSLPKDIDTRVIYTVVTKPTTRLEIVTGKVVGFARVSLAILCIMGIFTAVYLHIRAWGLRRDIVSRLNAGRIDPLSRATYEYWGRNGLLSSRSFKTADDLEVLARPPEANDTRRWFFGNYQADMIVPFRVSPQELIPSGFNGAPPGAAGLLVQLKLGFARSKYGTYTPPRLAPGIAGPEIPAIEPDPTAPVTSAEAAVQILDQNRNVRIAAAQINGGQPVLLKDPTGQTLVTTIIDPETCQNLLDMPLFYVQVIGTTPGVEYFADIRHDPNVLNNPVCVVVPGATQEAFHLIGPVDDGSGPVYQPALPTFRGRGGLYGQELRGGPPDRSPVAVFKFRGAGQRDPASRAAFEMLVGIERSGEDADESEATSVELTFVDPQTRQAGGSVTIHPENRRTTYFDVPATPLASGNFDVLVRVSNPGQFVGLLDNSLQLVASEEGFDLNLAKSLSILWMLSILVVIIALFCSTFLSWPIAAVLTLVVLLSHWGVAQLGDALAPGIGPRVAQDIFGSSTDSAAKAKVVSTTVEALSRIVSDFASVLPDIGQFSAIEDIERGVTIGAARLVAPLQVLAAFGVPILVLSYVFMRNKEVAP